MNKTKQTENNESIFQKLNHTIQHSLSFQQEMLSTINVSNLQSRSKVADSKDKLISVGHLFN